MHSTTISSLTGIRKIKLGYTKHHQTSANKTMIKIIVTVAHHHSIGQVLIVENTQ